MTCNRQPRESTESFRRKRSSTRKVSPLLRPRVVRFAVPKLSNEEPIMMFKAPWMGHPNERFLFPFGDSAEIFKLIYVLHHARNLKGNSKYRERSALLAHGLFSFTRAWWRKNFLEETRWGKFIQKCFERFEAIYGLNIRKVFSIEFIIRKKRIFVGKLSRKC